MAKRTKPRVTEQQKAFLVQRLACYDSPREAAEALKAEHGIEMSPQSVEHYDPHKRAGASLADKWRELFEATRKAFLNDLEDHVPIANRAVRLREMQKAFNAHKGRGNWGGAMQVLEQAAKEVGDVHTNKRELTGKGGGPIEFSELSDEQLNSRLDQMLGRLGVVSEAGASEGGETD